MRETSSEWLHHEHEVEDDPRCPACGEGIQWCLGHGEIGDPAGHRILERHDNGDHTDCNPGGCDVALAGMVGPS